MSVSHEKTVPNHAESASIEPFQVHVSDDELADLNRRLDATRWGSDALGTPWEDGTDPTFMRGLVAYWRAQFDWRAAEREMNAFPQFHATIDGQRIHFLRIPGIASPAAPPPLPLILTHGWPSTFLEYERLIPHLTDPVRHRGQPQDAFDVVIPSLPGFGFSNAPALPGMNVQRIAALWDTLMTRVLGYEKYAAHGSDIGAGVTTILGLDHPERLVAIHVTSPAGSTVVRWLGEGAAPLSDAERRFLREVDQWSEAEGAYAALQRTKPQTLANALGDSPVGLASWLVEKFRAWSDCGGEVERRFSRHALVRNIALYWFTKTIGPSMRLYFEGRRAPRRLARAERVDIPTAVALFPKDITRPPREWAERVYRVVRWTEMPRGGHFPAHEEPDMLAQDLREFFREFRS